MSSRLLLLIGPLSCGSVDPCGNGALDPEELCDDGNLSARDGCDSSCMPEKLCGEFGLGDQAMWCPRSKEELRCNLDPMARFHFSGDEFDSWEPGAPPGWTRSSSDALELVTEGSNSFLRVTGPTHERGAPYFLDSATWDPGPNPICRLEMSLALRGSQARVAMVVDQSGGLYSSPWSAMAEPAWTKFVGWTEAELSLLDGEGQDLPQLRSGSLLRFGFILQSSPGTSTRVSDLDDWNVTLYGDRP